MEVHLQALGIAEFEDSNCVIATSLRYNFQMPMLVPSSRLLGLWARPSRLPDFIRYGGEKHFSPALLPTPGVCGSLSSDLSALPPQPSPPPQSQKGQRVVPQLSSEDAEPQVCVRCGECVVQSPPPPLSLTHHLDSRPRIPGPTRSQGRKAQEETSHSEMRSPGQKKKKNCCWDL